MKKKRRAYLVTSATVLLFLAATVLSAGCGVDDRREEVVRVVDDAGEQEPGTGVSWIRVEDVEDEDEVLRDPMGRWAVEAEASSSLGEVMDVMSWTPRMATGFPDVQEYRFEERAWAPGGENDGYEWLEVTYENAVHATGVRVRVVNACGCVQMVQLKDVNGKYHLKWKGKDRENKHITWLVLEFPATGYLTDTVRVTLDTTRVPHWTAIDAVQLVGEPAGQL
jgi:hypothetical protein